MIKNWKLFFGIFLAYSFSHANYSLLLSRRPIVCYGPDNQSVVYNVNKGLKYTVEGESRGFERLIKIPNTDNRTYSTFETSTTILQISNQGDFFKIKGGDGRFTKVDCEMLKEI